MNLQTIIEEADVRIPNSFTEAQKIDWANEVNHEFFEIVKIPLTFIANGAATITVPASMREKNIRQVVTGSTYYRSLVYDRITPVYNHYWLTEQSATLNLSPTPSGKVVVLYDQKPTVSLVSVSDTPEAPPEYHWLYVLGLCVRIAKAMNDVGMANNYEVDYKGGLAVAQQNYIRGGAND